LRRAASSLQFREFNRFVRQENRDLIDDRIQQIAGLADEAAVDGTFEAFAREVGERASVDGAVDTGHHIGRSHMQPCARLRTAEDFKEVVCYHGGVDEVSEFRRAVSRDAVPERGAYGGARAKARAGILGAFRGRC
jgi:hypothetical protein